MSIIPCFLNRLIFPYLNLGSQSNLEHTSHSVFLTYFLKQENDAGVSKLGVCPLLSGFRIFGEGKPTKNISADTKNP